MKYILILLFLPCLLQAQPITPARHNYGSFAKYKPDTAAPNDTIFKFLVTKESRIILPRLGSWETYVSRYSPDHEEKRALWLCKRGDTLEILEKGLRDHMQGVLTIKVGGVYYSVPYGGAALTDFPGIYVNAEMYSSYTDTNTYNYNGPSYCNKAGVCDSCYTLSNIAARSGTLRADSGLALMNNVFKSDRHYTLIYTTDRMANNSYWYLPPVKKPKNKHEANIIRHFP